MSVCSFAAWRRCNACQEGPCRLHKICIGRFVATPWARISFISNAEISLQLSAAKPDPMVCRGTCVKRLHASGRTNPYMAAVHCRSNPRVHTQWHSLNIVWPASPQRTGAQTRWQCKDCGQEHAVPAARLIISCGMTKLHALLSQYLYGNICMSFSDIVGQAICRV